jgi:cytosine/adenosine deaminase-related metal-dependent hydrolase
MSCNDKLGDIGKADVLVDGTRIAAVGEGLAADGAEVVDASGMIVMPGMADTHTHMWETPFKGRIFDAWGMEYFTNIHPLVSFTNAEDVYAGIYAGAIESLSAGVTSIFDYSHCIRSSEHADAAMEALKAAGIRATFGYDLRGTDHSGKQSLKPSEGRFSDIERVTGKVDNSAESLLRLAVCLSEVTNDSKQQIAREIAFSRELGLRMSWHCNKAGEVTHLHKSGLLGADLMAAHGNYMTDADIDYLGGVGGFLTTQPEAETYAGRRSMSMVGRCHRRGVRIGLGIDVPVIMNYGLIAQMRLLFFLQRYMDGVIERHEGQFPVLRRKGVPTLAPRDIVRFVTTNGAEANGVGHVVGQIAPGFQADIVLLDTRAFGRGEGEPAGHVVTNCSQGDVRTVMVAGQFRKREGKMVGVDMDKMLSERIAARDRIYARAGEKPGQYKKAYWPWGAEH